MTPYLTNSTSFSSFDAHGAWPLSFLVSACSAELHQLCGRESQVVRADRSAASRQRPRASYAGLAQGSSSSREPRVSDSLPRHASDKRVQPVERVTRDISRIQSERELIHVAMQVL